MLEGQPACLRQMRKTELSLPLELSDLGGLSPRASPVASAQLRGLPLPRAGSPADLEAEQKPCAKPSPPSRGLESAVSRLVSVSPF